MAANKPFLPTMSPKFILRATVSVGVVATMIFYFRAAGSLTTNTDIWRSVSADVVEDAITGRSLLLQDWSLQDVVEESRSSDEPNSNYNRMTDSWTLQRHEYFETFYDFNSDQLKKNADKKGPVLDFLIGGWPKCGTTTLEANLGAYAPMPIADVCTPAHQAVYYAYNNWPKEYDHNNTKPLRGSKCPQYSENMKEISTHLPKTKMIFGIRHPVLWFQSFWNMLAKNDKNYGRHSPYDKMEPCRKGGPKCSNHCPGKQLMCMHRSAFHLSIAKWGKTQLTSEERQLLSPHLDYAGDNLVNQNVSNHIFLYEMQQMKKDDFWQDLADYLDIPEIRNDKYVSSHGQDRAWGDSNKINICDSKFDDFRKEMMPIAHEMQQWLTEYFIQVAEDPSRPDLVVPQPKRFQELIQEYSHDPCKRLQRQEDGTYQLKPEFASEKGDSADKIPMTATA